MGLFVSVNLDNR